MFAGDLASESFAFYPALFKDFSGWLNEFNSNADFISYENSLKCTEFNIPR